MQQNQQKMGHRMDGVVPLTAMDGVVPPTAKDGVVHPTAKDASVPAVQRHLVLSAEHQGRSQQSQRRPQGGRLMRMKVACFKL